MVQRAQYQPGEAINPVSRLQEQWSRGSFVLMVQLPPLLTASAGRIIEQIAARASSFDAVLAPDSPGGAVSLSSMAMATLLRRAGVEAVPQMSGRDRNRLALQSDMLGLSVPGVRNLLIDTRLPERVSLVQNPDARLVVDLYGPALLNAAATMRDDGRFTSGASIKTPPVFYLGALVVLEDRFPVEELSAAQFLVTTLLADVQHLADTLSTCYAAHTDFFQTRPLLVSLPLAVGSQEEADSNRNVLEDRAEALVGAIETLSMYEGVRGCNIVLERLADLAVVERVAFALASRREVQG